MGSSYTNVFVRTPDTRAVLATVTAARRSAYVAPGVVVFDEASDKQDPVELLALGESLSKIHKCVTLAVLDHDDALLWYKLHDRGKQIGEYNSSPGIGAEPTGGDAKTLCSALGVDRQRPLVEQILFGDDFASAQDRHRELAVALGLPAATVGFGFARLSHGDLPDDLDPLALLRTQTAALPGAAPPPRPKLPPQPIVRARDALAVLVGDKPQPFTEIFTSVVKHVHAACGGFGPDGSTFRCDDALRAVFGAETMHMRDVAARLRGLCDKVGEYQP